MQARWVLKQGCFSFFSRTVIPPALRERRRVHRCVVIATSKVTCRHGEQRRQLPLAASENLYLRLLSTEHCPPCGVTCVRLYSRRSPLTASPVLTSAAGSSIQPSGDDAGGKPMFPAAAARPEAGRHRPTSLSIPTPLQICLSGRRQRRRFSASFIKTPRLGLV